MHWQFRVFTCLFLLVSFFPTLGKSQEPIDLFSDAPKLDEGFVRIGAWNLRHMNLEGQAREFLIGENDEEDFEILIATFAEAIRDLNLDVVAIVEHQPRLNEPNRLGQLRKELNGSSDGPWLVDETNIEYEDPTNPFGNLQFGLLWNKDKVTINPDNDQLLTSLRQPRSNGQLVHKRLRAPWLVPMKAGDMELDLVILHLKSGGAFPQSQEVDAISGFIQSRMTGETQRHLVVLGDWNIRPDQSSGRFRLRKMMVPTSGMNLMRLLTVEEIRPSLAGWEALGSLDADSPVVDLLPFTHFNRTTIDTFLDHISISRTLDEIFDHPIQVNLPSGETDIQPGITIPRPVIPEEDYLNLTDHLPVVLTLRTSSGDTPLVVVADGLRIVGAVPNPVGDDVQNEKVSIKNFSGQPQPLNRWKIGDSTGNSFWVLTGQDGTVGAGQTVVVVRAGRPMFLNNTGDTIVLLNPDGDIVDSKSYGNASSGKVFQFD